MKINISVFEEWAKDRRIEYKELNPKVECPNCEGDGEIECDCCENVANCEACDGDGKIPFNDAGDFKFKYPDFLKSVYCDLKKLCLYTGMDFLGIVGGFIKTEQPRNKMKFKSNGKES